MTAEATYPLAFAADPEGAAALQAEVEMLLGVDEALVDADGLHVRFDADVVSDEEILATLPTGRLRVARRGAPRLKAN